MEGEYHEPEEVLDHIYNLFKDHSGELGLRYVAYGDEKLLPKYPAVVVSAGAMSRELLQTHKFHIFFNIDIWVLHARLDISHKTRTREDMALATAVKKLLDANTTLDGNIIFGYVDSETPGVMARPKGENVVSTRISWTGQSRQSFM